MVQFSQQFGAVIHIARRDDGGLPTDTISAAYEGSREAAVMLVLDGVTSREVDKVLDPIVLATGTHVRGVVYASITDDSVILTASACAHRVFAHHGSLRTSLSSHGIVCSNPDEAKTALSEQHTLQR